MVMQESGIEFDFSAALSCTKHDAINSIWPGVDFLIEEPARSIWLEVKNWEPSTLEPRRRGGQRHSFLSKMKSKTFFSETLRGKFLGTSAYLTLTNQHPTKDILYIVLLESPRLDRVHKDHATHRMRGLIERKGLWSVDVKVAVMDLGDWNRLFGNYAAVAVP